MRYSTAQRPERRAETAACRARIKLAAELDGLRAPALPGGGKI